jgi:hypothetical protein
LLCTNNVVISMNETKEIKSRFLFILQRDLLFDAILGVSISEKWFIVSTITEVMFSFLQTGISCRIDSLPLLGCCSNYKSSTGWMDQMGRSEGVAQLSVSAQRCRETMIVCSICIWLWTVSDVGGMFMKATNQVCEVYYVYFVVSS